MAIDYLYEFSTVGAPRYDLAVMTTCEYSLSSGAEAT